MGLFDPEIHNYRDRTLRCSLFKAPDRENWCEKRAGVEERESASPFSWLRAYSFSLLFFFFFATSLLSESLAQTSSDLL